MSFWIPLLNYGAVSVFGILLSASFCASLSALAKRPAFWCGTALLLAMQASVYLFHSGAYLKIIYPFVIHLPLLLLLYFLTKRLLWPLIAILTAYLSCQLRRWIALLTTAILGGESVMQAFVELIVTLPLLLLLLRIVSPAVRQVSGYPPRIQCHFGVIPALYYIFDYLTCVYTDLLASGNPVVVEFMPFVCCVAYLVFLMYHSVEEKRKVQLQQMQQSLDLQLNQAVREIQSLRESQALARQYRHDLRHHLQYLSACLENGQLKQAQAYISDIHKEMEGQVVQRYCENEAANLILSSFAQRAKTNGIEMRIQGTLPASIPVSDSDLCVVLSNALENAIHACPPVLSAEEKSIIDVQFYEKNRKLFLQITNPCPKPVRFRDGIPVSDEPEHGIGVQSICAIVQRYNGIYSFLVQDGHFILRLSL